jgi:hypothetical protein
LGLPSRRPSTRTAVAYRRGGEQTIPWTGTDRFLMSWLGASRDARPLPAVALDGDPVLTLHASGLLPVTITTTPPVITRRLPVMARITGTLAGRTAPLGAGMPGIETEPDGQLTTAASRMPALSPGHSSGSHPDCRLLTSRRTPCSGSDALPEENLSWDLCCALALRSAVVVTGRSAVACCFVTVSAVTDPVGTARICRDDDEVTTANFRRFGRTLGASPGQRATAGKDNESRAC